MACCSHSSVERQFDDRVARADLSRYRKKGPDRTTQMLIDVIGDAPPGAGTLLDVGAGIGVIHHELLDGVVTKATHVEVSQAYIDAARAEAQRREHSGTLEFVHGDFVELADALSAADIVTLDRVVCCYADYRALLAAAATKCNRLLAFSYPRERWLVRVVFWLQNRARALAGNTFSTFVHPEEELSKVLSGAGFERCFDGGTFAWGVRAYRRTSPAA